MKFNGIMLIEKKNWVRNLSIMIMLKSKTLLHRKKPASSCFEWCSYKEIF